MKTEINLLDINITKPLTTNMNPKCTVKKPLPTCIANQHRASVLTLSKVYSKVSFTEHNRYVREIYQRRRKIFNRYVC